MQLLLFNPKRAFSALFTRCVFPVSCLNDSQRSWISSLVDGEYVKIVIILCDAQQLLRERNFSARGNVLSYGELCHLNSSFSKISLALYEGR